MAEKGFTACPKCQAEISKVKYGDMEVEFCPNCKGFFMDLDDLLDSKASAFDDSDSPQRLDSEKLNELVIKCPKCAAEMFKRKPRKMGPILDFCPSCKGVWFDQGELRRNYKNWKGGTSQKQKKPLKLVCLDCHLEIESKYYEKQGVPANLKCFKCGKDLRFEFSKASYYRTHAWVVYLMGIFLLLGGVAWVLNYWTDHDDRAINKQQPLTINEMIYGGLVHVRARNSGMAFSPARFGPFFVKTGSMIDQKHAYYYRGIKDEGILVEYVYSDSKGKNNRESMKLILHDGKAQLRIPTLIQSEDSKKKTLALAVADDKRILVKEI